MIQSLFNPLVYISAIPGLDLVDIITGLGVLAVVAVIFAESGLLIGFFLPGDSLLFTAGVLVHAGVLNINIHLFVLLLFLAAVAGDSVGYTFGRKTGHHIFKKPDARIFKQDHIRKAQEFYEKHGGKTIIIARFIPIVRTFAPVVAGVGKMEYKRFLTYNIIGAFLWAAGITYLGFLLGTYFEYLGIDIDTVLLPIIAVIILLSILPPLIHIFKEKKQRQAFWEGTKRELKTVFKRK